MEARLQLLAQATAGLSAPFFERVAVEVAIAQAFAAALNTIEGDRDTGAEERVCAGEASSFSPPLALCFRLPPLGVTDRKRPDGSQEPTQSEWTRAAMDAFARCVDRALGRVYPPVDPLRYLGSGSPCFTSDAAHEAAPLAVTFLLSRATTAVSPGPTRYGVDGGATGADAAASLPPITVLTTTGRRADASGGAASASRPGTTVASEEVGCGRDDRNAEDEDLWRRARASRSDTAFLDALANCPHLSVEDAQQQQAKRVRLVRRFARHVTERLVNENSWATPVHTGAASSPSHGTAAAAHAHGRRGAVGHTANYVAFLTMQPSGVGYRTVLEAASAQSRRASDKPHVAGGTATKTARHGVVHVDVRGMEFTGAVVARTRRFAYIGIRDDGRRGDEAAFALVARVPVPSWLSEGDESEWDGEAHRDGNCRKRSRESSCGADATQALPHHLANGEEATLHDDLDGFRDLTRHALHVVDVRAHRVLCKTHPHTQKVSLWFEDAFLVAQHRSAASASSPSSSPDGDAVSSFTELMDLVNASCTRYLTERTHLQESWRAMQAEEKEDAQQQARNLKARRQEQQRRVDDAANHQGETKQVAEEGEADSTSVRSDAVALSESEASSFILRKAQRTEEAITTSGAAARLEDEDDEAKTARLQRQHTLRLFGAMGTLMKTMMDPSAVGFSKPRSGTGGSPSGTPALPEIRSCEDVERLNEGPTVEFKFALSGRDNAIMDAQRLRHTMAAMASTLGGIICVGVSDSGVVVGQPQGEVRAALRVSGFCPAMTNNAVTLRDVRVLEREEVGKDGSASSTLVTAKKGMPKDWWKVPAPSLLATPSADKKSGRSGARTAPVARAGQRVVTVISIARGAAPFYASGRTALPYVRGCASTTPMPIRVMCDRIFTELMASAMV